MARKKGTKTAGRKASRTSARSGKRKPVSGHGVSGEAIPPVLGEIFRNARDGMVLMDCDNWNIIEVNESFEEMVGFRKAELSGRKIWEIPDENNGEKLKRSFFKVFQEGACYQDHVMLQTRTNELLDAELNTTMIDGSEQKSMLCIFRPSESAAKPGELQYGRGNVRTGPVPMDELSSELIENANLIVIFINTSGEIIVFNHKAEEFTGKSRDEVAGKKFYDVLVAPKYRSEVMSKFTQMMEGSDFIEGHDYPILNSQGVERLVLWRNSLITKSQTGLVGLLSVGEDITDMKIMERRLKLYSDAIKSSIDCMMIIDMNGYILYNNRAAEAIYGYDPGELLGKNLRAVYNSVKVNELDGILDILMKKGFWQGERIHKKRDGTYSSVYQTMSLINDEHGRPIAIMVVGRDVTSAKRLEHELKTAQRNSEFYMDILTHDLCNLNQGILNQLDIVRRNIAYSDNNRKYIDQALSQLHTGINLINNVKKLTQIESNRAKLTPYELGSVIDYCKNRIGMRYPTRKINYWGNFNQVRYSVQADEFIYEIFTNLLDNSVKFDAHKDVDIGINISEHKKDFGSYIKISILDNGCGIPPAEKRSIFERYRSDGDQSKSNGLGLSIVKALIDRYGGKIFIEDRVRGDHSKGSIFSVILSAKA